MSDSSDSTEISIDGLVLPRLEQPRAPDEVAALLADCSGNGEAVVPFGGTTQLGLGNIPTGADVGLSLGRLNRVLAYEPDDLTLSVEAGVTLAELQRTLGERGQWLPIEAPLPERATVGGLIATAFSSPRKLGSESIRDLLVGISVAHPTGTVSKAGGTVVKNVTGFDMMRLYHGSLGTLGVIVSANFKVLPRPRTERTLFAAFASVDAGLAAARRLFELRGRPVALELLRDSDAGEWTLAVRYEGRDGTVGIMTDEASASLHTDVTSVDDVESSAWWQQYVDFYTTGIDADRVLVRASCRPRDIASLSAALQEAIGGISVTSMRVSPGLGRVDVSFDSAHVSGDDRGDLLSRVNSAATNAVLFDASPGWKQDRDIWGVSPDTIDVMRALKEQFDPGRVINPGRFAGFI